MTDAVNVVMLFIIGIEIKKNSVLGIIKNEWETGCET